MVKELAALGLGVATIMSTPATAETVTVETIIAASPDLVWQAVRDVYAVDTALVPGFVTDTVREGADVRVVTFASGAVIRERIVTIDDAGKRMAYSAFGGRIVHHMASMQVLPLGKGARIIWTTDFLPVELKGFIESNMAKGSAIMRQTLEERAKAPAAR